MRNKTIYEQSKDKNLIRLQFIVWKSDKQTMFSVIKKGEDRIIGDGYRDRTRTAELHQEQRNEN